MNPSSITQVTDFINEESTKTNWYKDNKYPDIVKSIYEYIVGYCLFNFGMPKPTKKLLHLFMHISNQDFFTDLGYKENFWEGTKINKQAVEAYLNEIINEDRKTYPRLNFNLSSVQFNNFSDFATSYLKEFSNLNLSK